MVASGNPPETKQPSGIFWHLNTTTEARTQATKLTRGTHGRDCQPQTGDGFQSFGPGRRADWPDYPAKDFSSDRGRREDGTVGARRARRREAATGLISLSSQYSLLRVQQLQSA